VFIYFEKTRFRKREEKTSSQHSKGQDASAGLVRGTLKGKRGRREGTLLVREEKREKPSAGFRMEDLAGGREAPAKTPRGDHKGIHPSKIRDLGKKTKKAGKRGRVELKTSKRGTQKRASEGLPGRLYASEKKG